MAVKAMKICSKPGCPTIVTSGRCTPHEQEAERRRGSSRQRGYDHEHETRFRPGVFKKDPMCVIRGPKCKGRSTVADHHPLSKRELQTRGLDSNDPQYGRGVCNPCHGQETAAKPDQRGGWNRR